MISTGTPGSPSSRVTSAIGRPTAAGIRVRFTPLLTTSSIGSPERAFLPAAGFWPMIVPRGAVKLKALRVSGLRPRFSASALARGSGLPAKSGTVTTLPRPRMASRGFSVSEKPSSRTAAATMRTAPTTGSNPRTLVISIALRHHGAIVVAANVVLLVVVVAAAATPTVMVTAEPLSSILPPSGSCEMTLPAFGSPAGTV